MQCKSSSDDLTLEVRIKNGNEDIAMGSATSGCTVILS